MIYRKYYSVLNKITIFLLVSLIPLSSFSQELNCQVDVVSPNIQMSNKRVFETLEQAIFEFMNTTSWTNDQFEINERIEGNIQINVTEMASPTSFKATMQVQYSRPVYGSNYKSLVFNFSDQDIAFDYIEYEQLQFNINSHISNLTSILAYYAYLVIGFDYDTFSPQGGSEYFAKAQQIVNNAQSAQEPGWKAFESDRNRYWIVEDILSQTFAPLRDCLYTYHRSGYDNMLKDQDAARDKILESLRDLEEVRKVRPGSFIMQIFFDAKSAELVNTFSNASPAQKGEAVALLIKLNPTNTDKYQQILGN